MRITSKGQVTIPQEMRQKLGLLPNSEVVFELHKDGVILRKASPSASSSGNGRGKALIDLMKGSATIKMSTEEILALTRG